MSFFSGLWDSFSGKTQQNAIDKANATSNSELDQGRTAVRGDYTKAQGYFNPYAEQGGRANAMYSDALGVNGEPARTAATANFAANNPYSKAGDDYAMRGVLRQYNARGASVGGNAMLAAQRVGSERFDNRYNTWMGQLQGQGQQGLQATGAQAGLQQGMGDIESGYHQQRAGNAISYGNATAANANTLTNNLFNVAGTIARFAAPVPIPGGGGGGQSGGGYQTQNVYGPQQPSTMQNLRGSINQLWGGY